MTLRQFRYLLLAEVSGIALMAHYDRLDRAPAMPKKTLAITRR